MVPLIVVVARGGLGVPHPANIDAVDDTAVVGHVYLLVVVVPCSGGSILEAEDLASGGRAGLDPRLFADLRGCAGHHLGRDQPVLTAVDPHAGAGLDAGTLRQGDAGSVGSVGLGGERRVFGRGARGLVEAPIQVGTL